MNINKKLLHLALNAMLDGRAISLSPFGIESEYFPNSIYYITNIDQYGALDVHDEMGKDYFAVSPDYFDLTPPKIQIPKGAKLVLFSNILEGQFEGDIVIDPSKWAVTSKFFEETFPIRNSTNKKELYMRDNIVIASNGNNTTAWHEHIGELLWIDLDNPKSELEGLALFIEKVNEGLNNM